MFPHVRFELFNVVNLAYRNPCSIDRLDVRCQVLSMQQEALHAGAYVGSLSRLSPLVLRVSQGKHAAA